MNRDIEKIEDETKLLKISNQLTIIEARYFAKNRPVLGKDVTELVQNKIVKGVRIQYLAVKNKRRITYTSI